MRNEKIRGMIGSGRGTGFVAMGALMACSWIVGCGGESDDDGSGDDGGTAGTSAGKGGTGGGKGGSAGSTSGAGGTGNAGSGGTAGTVVAGGTGGTQGGSAGTTGGTAGDAGGGAGEDAIGGTTGDAGDGNVGGEAAGGSAGDAGAGNAGGDAGAVGEGGAGGAAPDDPTVRGRLIDFYRHPVPGVTIGINGVEVVTDADGEFVFEDVPEVYDASFVVEVPNPTKIYGWVFQGLTRRDPTLQVFQGLAQRSMYTDLRAQDGAPTATQNLTLAAGSAHGTAQVQEIPANGRDFADYEWFGPTATAATAHGLMWSYDDATELPTNYVSYTTFPLALDDTTTDRPLINISVAPTAITQANIGGTVTDLAESGRVNYGFVRFTSGATIDLFEDDPGPATFSYLVPTLPNSSITFAAIDEDWTTREFALVHQDGITPGTTNLALTIPATPSLTAPANAATVDDTTEFRYQNRQEGVGAVVVRIEDTDYYQGLYIVTANAQFTVPEVLEGGFGLRIDGEHFWQVEAHGLYASVDEMASSTGYADTFAIDVVGTSGFTSAKGPRTNSGTLAMSGRRYFTYQP
jgi:hypothetical protein